MTATVLLALAAPAHHPNDDRATETPPYVADTPACEQLRVLMVPHAHHLARVRMRVRVRVRVRVKIRVTGKGEG